MPPPSEGAWECKQDSSPTLEDALAYIAQAHREGRVHWRLDGYMPINGCSEYPTPLGERADISIYPPKPQSWQVDFDTFCKQKKTLTNG